METRGKRALDRYFESEDSCEGQSTAEAVQPPAKQTKKYPRIFDGKYYSIKSDTGGNIEAICTVCEEVKKGNCLSTGNFISHYKLKHHELAQKLKDYTKENLRKKELPNQPTLNEVLTATPDNIATKALNFVIDGNLSFNVVQLKSFQELLTTVSGRKIAIPTRHKFMKTLDSEYGKMKEKLTETLKSQKYLCITADVWSSRAQSYLGVTVHFLNKEYKRESYVLAFKQLFAKQTYKELARAMNQIFEEYGIQQSQITNIVTDGGSNFCKMFKMYGKSIDTIVTTYDDEVLSDFDDEECENGESLEEANTTLSFMSDTNGDAFVNEVLSFDDNVFSDTATEHSIIGQTDSFDEEATSETDFDSYFADTITNNISEKDDKIEFAPQRRCVSHLLNCLSQDFENKYLTGTAKKALCSTLSKLHTLWVLIRRSTQAKTICKQILGKILKIQNDTRWNSRFDAVKMCTEPNIQKNLNKLILQLKSELSCISAQNLQVLNTRDFSIMEHYVMVVEPVAVALDIMQKELNSSQGYIFPVLNSMKNRIAAINVTNSNIISDFKTAMLNAIDSRFTNYFLFNDNNKDLLLASVTLPNIKTSFIKEDDDIIYTKNLLIAECKKMKQENLEERNTVQPEPVSEQDDFIISYTRSTEIHRRNSLESEVESEVARYLCDNRTDISILNDYPNVRQAYYKFNTTLSSSAPIERVFSQSLMIFTPRRNRLSALHFEQALLMKHNRKLLTETKRLKN